MASDRMSWRTSVLVLVAAGAAFVAGRSLPPGGAAIASQPDKGKAGQPAGDPMEAMMAAMQPGAHHKVLDSMVGDWEGSVKIWMAPGQPPIEAKGTIRREWAMDGRFVVEHVESEMMGQRFKGMGIVGYDTLGKKYQSVWIENMSTAIAVADGSYDPATKTFTFLGDMIDPMTGQKVRQRSVADCSNPDREVFSGYHAGPDGKETKNFEGVFERVKK